jgi:hypothetical protein
VDKASLLALIEFAFNILPEVSRRYIDDVTLDGSGDDCEIVITTVWGDKKQAWIVRVHETDPVE